MGTNRDTDRLAQAVIDFVNTKKPEAASIAWYENLRSIYGNTLELPPLKRRRLKKESYDFKAKTFVRFIDHKKEVSELQSDMRKDLTRITSEESLVDIFVRPYKDDGNFLLFHTGLVFSGDKTITEVPPIDVDEYVSCEGELHVDENMMRGNLVFCLLQFLKADRRNCRRIKLCPHCQDFFIAHDIRRQRCKKEECKRAYERSKKKKQRDTDPVKYV